MGRTNVTKIMMNKIKDYTKDTNINCPYCRDDNVRENNVHEFEHLCLTCFRMFYLAQNERLPTSMIVEYVKESTYKAGFEDGQEEGHKRGYGVGYEQALKDKANELMKDDKV